MYWMCSVIGCVQLFQAIEESVKYKWYDRI